MSTPPVNPPRKYTARELAEWLTNYGDLPVAVVVVDQDGHESTVLDIRLELNIKEYGRYVAVTAYESDEDTAAEVKHIIAANALTETQQFFYDNAAWSHAIDQDPEEGHIETAKLLARAEAYAEQTNISFQWWEDDEDMPLVEDRSWRCDAGRMSDGPFEPLVVLSSVGGVTSNPYTEHGTDWTDYARVIAAELAAEIMHRELEES